MLKNMTKFLSGLAAGLSHAWTAAITALQRALSSVARGVSHAWTAAMTSLQKALSSVARGVSGAWNALVRSTRKSAAGLVNGLSRLAPPFAAVFTRVGVLVNRAVASRRRLVIDIGDQSVRLIWVAGRDVKKWGEAILPPGAVVDGVIRDPRAFSTELANLLRSLQIPARRVAFTIADPTAVVRKVVIPRLSTKETEEALRREVQLLTPVPLDQLRYAWIRLARGADLQEVLLVVTLVHPAESAARALGDARLKPYFGTHRVLALAQAVNKPNAAVINLESDSLDLVFLQNNVPIYISSVFHSLGRAADQGRWLEFIHREWNHGIDAMPVGFRAQVGTGEVPLVLTGLAAEDPGLDRGIEKSLGITAVPFSSPFRHPANFPVFRYAASLGLALGVRAQPGGFGWTRARNSPLGALRLNVVPEFARPRALRIKQGAAVLSVLACLGLAYPFYHYTTGIDKDVDQLEVTAGNLEDAVVSRQVATARASQILQVTRALTAQRDVISSRALDPLDPERAATFKVRTLQAVGPGVRLTNWNLDQAAGLVSGRAENTADVYSYVDRLRTTGAFSQISLGSLRANTLIGDEEQSGYTFTLLISP